MRSSNICRNNTKPPRNHLFLFAGALACLGFCQSGLALDPARGLSQYVHQAWGPEQGLVGGAIYAISRSADGYLWLGTDRGLVRFDGTAFDLIQQPIPSLPPIGRVRSLATDAQGTLWVLLEGAHLLLYRNGQFSDAFASLGLPRTTITALSLDKNFNVLLSGLENQALRSVNGKIEPVANAEAVPGTVTSIAESLDGRIWMGTRDNGLFASVRGSVAKVPYVFGDNKINALVPDFNGGVWVGTDQGVYFLTRTVELANPLPEWKNRHSILTMFRDRDACVWAGTESGLIRISPAGQASFRRSIQGGTVNAIFQDAEFNLWFGGSGGLERLQDGVFSTYSSAEGLPAVPMGPIYADNDAGVWFAPVSGGFYRYRGGRLQQVRQDGLGLDLVYSIDGAGPDVWVGRQHGGLTRIRRVGEKVLARTFTQKEGLAQNAVYAVHVSPHGSVWAGTVSAGISVFDGSDFKTYTTANGLSSNTINSITETRDARIWVATPNGIDEFRDGRWINWSAGKGLPSADVKLCFADSKSVVWLASAEGLAYLAGGRITMLHQLPGPLREPILGIAEDRLGFLWFSTFDHVLRASRNLLLADAVRFNDLQSYGASDGLSGIEALRRERSLVADPTGRIWISLSHGMASGEPTLTERDAIPVQARINSVSANGQDVVFATAPIMPAGTRSMTFQYSIESLFAPERARFRYRLEGAQAEWSEIVGWRQALYNNLGPGHYKFRVIASRDGALWNGPETAYAFSIDPAFWQTWWFETAGVVAVLLSVLVFVRLRNIRLARQLNARFEERLLERTRIARELHDTLLQSFQGLMLRLQLVDDLLPDGRAKDQLEQTLERADQAIAEGRNAVSDLRSSAAVANDLQAAVRNVADELSTDGGPTFRLVVEGSPRDLHPILRDEVYRITREALRNAFSHARAQHIETEIAYAAQLFRLRIRDDGDGISPDYLQRGRPAHYGLSGMRERAQSVGGRLDIWSSAGTGTEIDLTVPASVAYAKTPGRTRLRLFRRKVGLRT